jgi:hypothetical protein
MARERRMIASTDSPVLPGTTLDSRAEIERAWKILGRLNALPPGDFAAMRAILGELTGRELDPSVRVLPPFHTDGGRRCRRRRRRGGHEGRPAAHAGRRRPREGDPRPLTIR